MGEGEQGQGASGSVPDPASGAPEEPSPSQAAPEPAAEPAAATPATTLAPARSTRRRRRWRRVLISMAVSMAVLVAAAAGTAYVLYKRLDGQITTEDVAQKIGPSRPPVMPEAYGAVNILLMGSDDRSGENVKYGDVGEGTKRSDTTILLHLAADRKSSVAVSIPRDLMVQIPSCVRDDGTESRAYKDQFNHAFEIGGSACTIKTVEQFTQVQIDHHIVIDFTGFKHMVDAVDGVEVCLTEPLRDHDAKLDLAAGPQKLNGEQSLAFVRARKNLGDGSDTQRMVRQQRFLASLLNKVKSNGVLFNPVKLYELLDAGTRSITADPGLDSLDELTRLSRSVSNIPADKTAFLTVPRQQYRFDSNRDELVQPDADALFTAIRYDRVAVAKPVPGAAEDPGGSVRIDDPNPTGLSTPTATGAASGAPSATASPRTTDHATDHSGTPGASPSALPSGRAGKGTTPTASETASAATLETTSPPSPASSAPPSSTPPPSGTAPASGVPSAPPATESIVTVTGRTVDQDVCA